MKTEKNAKLIKSFEFKVAKASDDGKTGFIEGYASTFNNLDSYMDIVKRGAFARTIQDKNGIFPILLDHDPRTPIGWNVSAAEDNFGLFVKGEINLVTEEAQNRYMLAKRALELNTKMGLSIGYSTIRSEPDPVNPMITYLTELKLWEYSFVVFPANTEAGVENAKADKVKFLFDEMKKGSYPESIYKALRDLGIANPELEAASPMQLDPEILQSVDKLIRSMSL